MSNGINVAQLNVEIGADDTPLISGVENSGTAFEGLESIVAQIAEAMTGSLMGVVGTIGDMAASTEASSGAMREGLAGVEGSIAALGASADTVSMEMRAGFANVEGAILGVQYSTTAMTGSMITEFQAVIAQLDRIAASTEATSAQISALGAKAASAAGGVSALGAAGTLISTGMGAGAAGLTLAAVAAAKFGSDFEYHSATVAGNTAMTTKELDFMRQATLQLGKDTGQTFDGLQNGYMHIANFGMHGADAMKILTEANKSAVSTGADVSGMAEVAAKGLHEYGLGAEYAGKVINTFHMAAAQGNMTLEQFDAAMGPAIGVAANFGVKLQDVAAAESALTQHGFDAAEGATQLKSIMEHIVNPASDAAKHIKKLSDATGIYLTKDFTKAGLEAKGLSGVIDDLTKATHGNEDEIMKVIPALRGGFGAMILAGTGAKDYHERLDTLNKTMSGELDPTTAAYNVTMATAHMQFEKLAREIEGDLIPVGMKLIPVFQGMIPAIKAVAEHVVTVLTWFSKLPQGVQEGILIFGTFSAVSLALGRGLGDTALAVEGVSRVFGVLKGAIFGATEATAAEATATVTANGAIAASTGLVGVLQAAYGKLTAAISFAVSTTVTRSLVAGGVTAAWTAITTGLAAAWTAVTTAIVAATSAVMAFLIAAAPLLLLAAGAAAVGYAAKGIADSQIQEADAKMQDDGTGDQLNMRMAHINKLRDEAHKTEGAVHDRIMKNLGIEKQALEHMHDSYNREHGVYNSSEMANAARVHEHASAEAAAKRLKAHETAKAPRVDFSGGGGKGKKSEGEKEDDKYQSANADLMKEIAGLEVPEKIIAGKAIESSKEAETRIATQIGSLKGLTDAHKEALISQAALLDQDKAYHDITKGLSAEARTLEATIGAGAKATEYQALAYKYATQSLDGLTASQQKAVKVAEAHILTLTKQKEIDAAFQPMREKQSMLQETPEKRQVIEAAGGEKLWKDLGTFGKQEEFTQQFNATQNMQKIDDLQQALRKLRDTATEIHDPLEKMSADAYGGAEAWRKLGETVNAAGVNIGHALQHTYENQIGVNAFNGAVEKLRSISEAATDPMERLSAASYGSAEGWKALGEVTDASGKKIGQTAQAMYAYAVVTDTYSKNLQKLRNGFFEVTDPLEKLAMEAYGGAEAWKALGEATNAAGVKVGKTLQDAYAGFVGLKTAITDFRSILTDDLKQIGDNGEAALTNFAKLENKLNTTLDALHLLRTNSDLAPFIKAMEDAAHVQDHMLAQERLKTWVGDLTAAGAGLAAQLNATFSAGDKAVNAWEKSHVQDIALLKAQYNDMPGMAQKMIDAVEGMVKANADLEKAQAPVLRLRDMYADLQRQSQMMNAGNPFDQYLVSLKQVDAETHMLVDPFDLAHNKELRDYIKGMYEYNQTLAMAKEAADGLGDSIMSAFDKAIHPDLSGLQSLQSQLKSLQNQQRLTAIQVYENRGNAQNPYTAQLNYINQQIDGIQKKISNMAPTLWGTFVKFFQNVLIGFDQTLQKMAMDYLKSQLVSYLEGVAGKMIKGMPTLPGGTAASGAAEAAVAKAQGIAAQMIKDAASQLKSDSKAVHDELMTAIKQLDNSAKAMQKAIEDAGHNEQEAIKSASSALDQAATKVENTWVSTADIVQSRLTESAGAVSEASSGLSSAGGLLSDAANALTLAADALRQAGGSGQSSSGVSGIFDSLLGYITGSGGGGGAGNDALDAAVYGNASVSNYIGPDTLGALPVLNGSSAATGTAQVNARVSTAPAPVQNVTHNHYYQFPPGTNAQTFIQNQGAIAQNAKAQTERAYQRNR